MQAFSVEVVLSGPGDVLSVHASAEAAAVAAGQLVKQGTACFLRLAESARDPHPVLQPEAYAAWCRAPRS